MDPKGHIMIPGINDNVALLTEEEKQLYEKIDFDLEEYSKDVGVKQLLHDSKARTLFIFLTSPSK